MNSEEPETSPAERAFWRKVYLWVLACFAVLVAAMFLFTRLTL